MSKKYRLPTRQKIDELNKKAQEMRHQDTRLALRLSLQAQQLAQQIDYQHGFAYSQYIISLCHFILADAVDIWEMAYRAYSLFLSLQDAYGQAMALNLLGSICNRQNLYAESLEFHHRCLELRKSIGDTAGQCGSLNNLGLAYFATNQIPAALEYLFQSLELSESIQNELLSAYALCNIAEIFIQTEEYIDALQYSQRGLALVHKTKDRALESTALTNMGRIYSQRKDHQTAFKYLQAGLDLARQTGNVNDKGLALLGLGLSQQEFGDYENARASLSEALEIMAQTNDRAHKAEVLAGLGKNFLLQGQPEEAITLLGQALELTHQIQGEKQAGIAHRLLSNAYEAQGNSAAALRHFREYHEHQQKIFNAETQRRIRLLLAHKELKQVQRQADEERLRNDELSRALDAARQSDLEKEQLLNELATQAEILKQLAQEDGLTGVANRRWLDIQLAREFERAIRFGHPLSVAMIDIDNFKQVNDQLSHLVGDTVLQRVAKLLRDRCRSVDIVGRYGGEEFMLVFVETNIQQAHSLCEKLRQAVEAHDWTTIHPDLNKLTISVGLTDINNKSNPIEVTQLADENLYQAKKRGKNRVVGFT